VIAVLPQESDGLLSVDFLGVGAFLAVPFDAAFTSSAGLVS